VLLSRSECQKDPKFFVRTGPRLSGLKPQFLSGQNLGFRAKMSNFCPAPALGFKGIVRGPVQTWSRRTKETLYALLRSRMTLSRVVKHIWDSGRAHCMRDEVRAVSVHSLSRHPILGTLSWESGVTVSFRPNVHRVSPVTTNVHWTQCSFLGNHEKITINRNPAFSGLYFFWHF
jgi:hypothetical protein